MCMLKEDKVYTLMYSRFFYFYVQDWYCMCFVVNHHKYLDKHSDSHNNHDCLFHTCSQEEGRDQKYGGRHSGKDQMQCNDEFLPWIAEATKTNMCLEKMKIFGWT